MDNAGTLVCCFILLLIGACGCTGTTPGSNTTTGETPTLPAAYVAGETTPLSTNAAAPLLPVTTNTAPANIMGAQVNTTLTEVTIACTGQTCTNGVNNDTTSGSGTVTAPVSAIAANMTMAYVKQDPDVAVQFTDASVNTPPYSYMWSWAPGGNLTFNSDPSIVLVFTRYGIYTVTRSVTNSAGAASSSATVSVCPLVASFATNQTTGPAPLAVQFTDTSTDQPTSWSWNFGDGSTSTLQNPVHSFTIAGSYTVSLSATNRLGSCGNTTGISVSSLSASFTANQTAGLAPLAVQFTDTSTDQPTSWSWNFGDGSTSTLQNPVHTYSGAGVYEVNFSATNGFNGWITAPSQSITTYSLPVVSFTAAPLSGTPGTSVLFSDQSAGFPAPSSWYWDFGDGFSSTQKSPSHQYARSGAYAVSHSATNSQGTVWLNKTAYITIS
ncbi:PKD domain-containing protein [Methanoregula sp.]|uniref:PKD domain-containing protein n=1 Tax=Methanoregula sp. TaxID=2052170 RepID=UPI002D16B1B5|nr:PKD domain-containing protein [Methanoregula sp.]HVP97032.1 PKD domain-containing protein [Methanoregula sp.]